MANAKPKGGTAAPSIETPQKRVLSGAIGAPNLKSQIKTGRTVIVCCKYPNGMILRLQQKETAIEQTMTGPKEFDRWVDKPGSPKYVIAGAGYPVMAPKGFPRQVPIEGAYGMTFGIPADFWAEWVEQNKLAPYVVDGAIFAMSSRDDATALARENESFKTGLEPLEVGRERITDHRLPKPKAAHIYYTEADARAETHSA